MKNNATCTIRSEKITIDVRICAALAANRGGEVYLAAIAPDMELTVITLDEAPGILPCFEEDDACLNLPDTSLLLCYNPAQVLKMGGKHYLTGPVILVRTNMDGEVISLTIDEVYLFQKYLASHSITLMADDQKLPCISTSKGVLKEADFSSPRISRLISYLLISRKNAISPQEITQTLWPDDLDNPAKNVKGLIYRLRQKFNLISDEPLILSSASGYQLNPELHIMTDYQRFDELVSSAVRASSIINKVDILKNALDLYHGKVLSSADGEHWLIQFSTKYHLSYMGAVSELLRQLDSLHNRISFILAFIAKVRNPL